MPRNQSGFKPGDSCVNQLLAITHEYFPALMTITKLERGIPSHFKSFP